MFFHLDFVAAWGHVDFALFQRYSFLNTFDNPAHTAQRDTGPCIFSNVDQVRKTFIDAISIGMPLDQLGVVGD